MAYQNISLDKGQDVKGEETQANGILINRDNLQGCPIHYIKGRPSTEESTEDRLRFGMSPIPKDFEGLSERGLTLVPTYVLAHAIGMGLNLPETTKTMRPYDPLFTGDVLSAGEKLVLWDRKGILGKAGARYSVDTQNGGLFLGSKGDLWDRYDDLRAINTCGPLMRLNQNEVDEVLDAIQRRDDSYFQETGWAKSTEFHLFDGFADFRDASEATDFLRSNPSYTVVREVSKIPTFPEYGGMRSAPIKEQAEDQDNLIHTGGIKPFDEVLERSAREFGVKQPVHHFQYDGTNKGGIALMGRNHVIFDNIVWGHPVVGASQKDLEARTRIVDSSTGEERNTPAETTPRNQASCLPDRCC